MGRIADFVVLAVVILATLTIQFAGGQMLTPLRDTLTDEAGETANVNGEEHMNQIFTAVTKWVPLIAQIGSVVIVAYREYRRQTVGRFQGRVS